MYLLRRSIPLVLSFLFLLFFVVLTIQPEWLLKILNLEKISLAIIWGSFLILLILLITALLEIGSGHLVIERLRFLFFPFLTFASGYFIFLFSDYAPLLLSITIIVPLSIWIWYESLYLFWQQPQAYQAYTLESLANYLYILTIFLFVIAITGAQILFHLPFWGALLIAAIFFWLIQIDQLMLYKLDLKESIFFSLIGTFIAVELLIVINLLPTHFFLYGLFISLFFYVWLGISRQVLKRTYTLKKSLVYISIASSGFILTFFTSLWIK